MDKRMVVITGVILLSGSLYLSHRYDNSFAQEVPKVEYTSQNLRDPFKSPWEEEVFVGPVKEKEIVLPSLSVQGIVWGVEPAKAIINEQVVGKGDTILDARVLDIKKDGVYLLYKGKKFVIKP